MDWAGPILMSCCVLIVVGVVIGCVEYEQPPRGLRWTVNLWSNLRDGIQWILLRVFYPERLPQKEKKTRKLSISIPPFYMPDESYNSEGYRVPSTLDKLEALDRDYRIRDGNVVWNEAQQCWDSPSLSKLRHLDSQRCIDEEVEHEGPDCECSEWGKPRPDFVDAYTDEGLYNPRAHQERYP